MIIKEEFLSKLRRYFNLNLYEVKIWTALLSRGVSTAGELSDIANVPRSRSYDVLEALEKKGFVIMKLGKPIKYIAVPPKEVLERVKKNVKTDAEEAVKRLEELKTTDIVTELNSLHTQGVELISTGGTAKALRDAKLPVRDVSEVTGFPEMLDGRVKTLHPMVHGGLLGIRGNAEHEKTMADYKILPIDLLVVNLYPFEATVARGGDYDDCVENIDIGGPAMIRAAAKNHAGVAVVVDVADYAVVEADMKANNNAITTATKKALAARAYARTAAYDAAISTWFASELQEEFPRWLSFAGSLKQTLRAVSYTHLTLPTNREV